MRNTILLSIIALGLASCSENFNDWGSPQSNAQNEAVTPEFGTITVAQTKATVDFTTEVIGDSIQLFTVTSGKVSGKFIVQLSDATAGGHYDMEADSVGNVSSQELKKAVKYLGGKPKVMTAYTAAVSKENNVVTPDGTVSTIFKLDSFPLGVKWTYDQATNGQEIYGSHCCAYGLADGTVALYKFYLYAGCDSTDITFPATVQVWEGETMTAEYEVSQVGYSTWKNVWIDNAGSNDIDTIKKVTVSEGIKVINTQAFGWGATSLEELYLPSTLTTIGAGAFAACDSLKAITCDAATAPTLDTSVGWDQHFMGSDTKGWTYIFNHCKVYVPSEAAKETYNTSSWSYWQEFYKAGNVVVNNK